MSRNYYMVRMTNATETEYTLAFEKGFVAIGWSEIDLSRYASDIEAAVHAVKGRYYSSGNAAPQMIGRKLSEINRYLKIKENDVIILPYYSGIRIGIAGKRNFYDETLYGMDLANCVNVSFLSAKDHTPLTIARKELTEGLQRRLRVRGMTVSDLYEFGEEIESIVSKGGYTSDNEFFRKEEEYKELFKKQLLRNIQTGNTHLQTGGIGLENLVKELLECDGYSARRCATTATKGAGDIDVIADRSSRFGQERIAVQIKHHDGISDDWGVRQLVAASDYYNDPDCKYVFVTSAMPSAEARKMAEDFNFHVIDGHELTEWIYDSVSKLSSEMLRALGISQIPQII